MLCVLIHLFCPVIFPLFLSLVINISWIHSFNHPLNFNPSISLHFHFTLHQTILRLKMSFIRLILLLRSVLSAVLRSPTSRSWSIFLLSSLKENCPKWSWTTDSQVRLLIYTDAHIHIRMHNAHSHTHESTHTYTHVQTSMHTHIRTHAYVYTYILLSSKIHNPFLNILP